MSVNPFDPSFCKNPYPFYPALLAEPPQRLPLFLPTILVARYRDVVGVLADHERFSSSMPPLPFLAKLSPFGGAPTLLLSNPPVHTRLRKVATKCFRPSMIEKLGPRIRAVTDALLDGIAAKGEFDGVHDLAIPLPVAISAHLLGVPVEDQPMLKTWSDELFAAARKGLAIAGALMTGGDVGSAADGGADATLSLLLDGSIPVNIADAIAGLREYFMRAVKRRQASPTDDLVSALVAALHEGVLDIDELLAFVVLMMFAGSETTTNLIANALLVLGTHRQQCEELQSARELIPSALEEILRYDSPVQMIMRYATEDTCLAGTSIPSGAPIVVMLGAANRDPMQFSRPERFDIRRSPNEHVAFGEGIHSCVGNQLGRLQGRIVIAALLERFPALRLRDPDAPLDYEGSLVSRGLSALPMIAA